MYQTEADRLVEQLFRSYHKLKLKLEVLQPRYTHVMREAVSSGHAGGSSCVEDLVAERADLSAKIRLIELCLDGLTKDERRFVDLRYFQDIRMREMPDLMPGWTEREIFRLRKSVLSKSSWMMGIAGEGREK